MREKSAQNSRNNTKTIENTREFTQLFHCSIARLLLRREFSLWRNNIAQLFNCFLFLVLCSLFHVPAVFGSSTYYLGSIEREYDSEGVFSGTTVYYDAGLATAVRSIPATGIQTVSYLHPDHLGSTVLIVRPDGSINSTHHYFPYGNPATGNRQLVTDSLFTGQRNDLSTGLYYYNARYYNPNTGHFISADKAEGPNRYAYAGNNPIMRNDPGGNITDEERDLLLQSFIESWGDESLPREFTDLNGKPDQQFIMLLRAYIGYMEFSTGYDDPQSNPENIVQKLTDDKITWEVLKRSGGNAGCLTDRECFIDKTVGKKGSLQDYPYFWGVDTNSLYSYISSKKGTLYYPFWSQSKTQVGRNVLTQHLQIASKSFEDSEAVSMYYPDIYIKSYYAVSPNGNNSATLMKNISTLEQSYQSHISQNALSPFRIEAYTYDHATKQILIGYYVNSQPVKIEKPAPQPKVNQESKPLPHGYLRPQ